MPVPPAMEESDLISFVVTVTTRLLKEPFKQLDNILKSVLSSLAATPVSSLPAINERLCEGYKTLYLLCGSQKMPLLRRQDVACV